MGTLLPIEGPGADTGERHNPVHVSILLTYHQPNPRKRRRTYQRADGTIEIREYDREDIQHFKLISTALTEEALDPDDGPDLIAREAALSIRRQLIADGWPNGERCA